jgi:hypothetical protein
MSVLGVESRAIARRKVEKAIDLREILDFPPGPMADQVIALRLATPLANFTTSLDAAQSLLDDAKWWWEVKRRKNQPGCGRPNRGGGFHKFVASVGRHDVWEWKGLARGTSSISAAHALSIAIVRALAL